MADDPRRLDTLETVLANLKRQIDGLQNTTLNRLATHVHSGGGGGVTDHGALTGLGDDDHTQYHNDTRGDIRYYTKSAADTLLLGKSDTSHNHDHGALTGLGDDDHTQYLLANGTRSVSGDLTVQGTGKAYRLRRSGAALDLEFGGASLYLSGWTADTFTGTQSIAAIIDTDGDVDFQQNVAIGGLDVESRLNTYPLSEYGMIASSIHPDDVNSTTANSVSVKTVEFYRILIPANTLVTGGCCYVGTAGVGPGAANASGFSLYDSAGVQLRTTANDYTIFTSPGWRSKAFNSTYTTGSTAGWYWVGMVHTCATTAPRFATTIGAGSGFYNAKVGGGTHRRGIFQAGVTTWPASFTPSTYGSVDNPMLLLGVY